MIERWSVGVSFHLIVEAAAVHDCCEIAVPLFRLPDWWSRWRAASSGPWRPTKAPDVFEDFETTIDDVALREGCCRIGVEPVGETHIGNTLRSVSTVALAPDGTRSWVKVSALRGRSTHWLLEGELSIGQVVGVPQARLLRTAVWNVGDVQYTALQWSLAETGAIEPGPWAGENAAQVSEAWICRLRDALAALGQVQTERWRHQQDGVRWIIRNHFGRGAPNVVDEWRTAHGDLQWSNLGGPELMIFDWECWGRAPRGYDAAILIAASCAQPELTARLEHAFADDLQTPSGRVARLAALATMLQFIESGWADPAYKRPLNAMARRVLAMR